LPKVRLDAEEIERIAQALGRAPSIVELHAFDAQWSEHCSYKSSRSHLKGLPTTGDAVVVGVGEDAGIVHLGEHGGDAYAIVIAHESHNHPSQVVPFEGAATGVGGVVRDVLCMGAEVIGIADALRFGDVAEANAHQRYVARGVVDGIAAYGNAIGVPNLAGDLYCDPRFDDNCLVNVVALGLVKEGEIVHSRAPAGSHGWDIVLAGKATDASGFGGASFSSSGLDPTDDAANKGAVQVPDPFLKNVLMRAFYRTFAFLRERNVVVGCKDLGAGGIMGCSAEICAAGNYGATIDLDAVNAAIEGLPAEVLAVGETQERMILIVPPDMTADVLRIFNEEFTLPEIARGARATVIGTVTDEKRYVLRHGSEIVMDVDIDFLTGSIASDLPFAGAASASDVIPSATSVSECSRGTASQLWPDGPHYEHYDAVVRGRTVLPRGTAEAGVLAPVPGSRLGVALSVAGDPGIADAYAAGEFAVREAVRKVRSVGARPLALTDCLNFGDPHDPAQLGELVAAIAGLSAAADDLGLPFVSGNVSLHNVGADGHAIPPSPIVACVGVIDDVSNVVLPRAQT
jgi:phosphoribosylformylglycinamidine synthase